jgi:hypothetical protein
MRVTIYLTEVQGEQLEKLATVEHRTVRQQATILILKALEIQATASAQQREIVAA